MAENVNDIQVGGTHYKTKFQHWDFVGECLEGRYLEGCATKYPSRWRKKGEGLKDLKKSVHYIDKIVSKFLDGNYPPMLTLRMEKGTSIGDKVEQFCGANSLTPVESDIIKHLACWSCLEDLLYARHILLNLIEAEQAIVDEIMAMRQENP